MYHQSRITKFFPSSISKKDDSRRLDIITDQFAQEIPQHISKIPLTVKYIHPGIELIYLPVSDYFALYTTKMIPPNTLLVFEEAVIGTTHQLELYLEQHPKLARDLYPRSIQQEPDNGDSLLKQKISYNVWEWYDADDNDPISMKSLSALFFYLSKINHSCAPNAFVARQTFSTPSKGPIDDHETEYKGGYALFSTDMIYAGQEIVTSYSTQTGHEDRHHLKTCPCWLDFKDRRRNFNRASKLASRYWNNSKHHLLQEIYGDDVILDDK